MSYAYAQPVSPRTAVAYARYSSSGQRDVSIDQQLRDIRAYAQREGYVILREYADHAKSGFKDSRKRTAFQKMMADAEKKDFSTVIAWKVDRFGRNREESAVYKGRLRRLGVNLAYVMEPIPEGAAGALMEGMLEATAEWYSRNLSENVTRGMYDNAVHALANGAYSYGFCRGQDDHIALDPARAPVVREIFDTYLQGYSASAIAGILNSRGITTARGNPWTSKAIIAILKNDRYTGVYRYGHVVLEDSVPAVVSKSSFQEVQQMLSFSHRAIRQEDHDSEFILTGRMYCGLCGASMIGDSGTAKSGARHYYYSCLQKKNHRACKLRSIRKDEIENSVIDFLLDQVLTEPVMEAMADIVHREYLKLKESSPIPLLEKTLSDVNRQIKNINTAIANGIYSSSTVATLKDLEARAEDLTQELRVQKAVEADYSDRDRVLFWLHKMKKADRTKYASRVSLVNTFVNSIYVFEDHVQLLVNTKENAERIPFGMLPDPPADPETLRGSSFDGLVHHFVRGSNIFVFRLPRKNKKAPGENAQS